MTDLLRRLRPVPSGSRPRSLGLRSWWLRLLHRHRPLLVAVLAGLAVLAALDQVTGKHDTVTVLVAGEDLAPGADLTPDQVHPLDLPAGLEPAGALTRVPERARLTGPVRSGEILTDVRVSTSGLPAVPAGSAIVPVPLGAAVSRWLPAGQDVLLFAGPHTDPPAEGTRWPTPIRATVLAVADGAEDDVTGTGGGVVTFLVAVRQGDAPALVAGSGTGSLVPVLVP